MPERPGSEGNDHVHDVTDVSPAPSWSKTLGSLAPRPRRDSVSGGVGLLDWFRVENFQLLMLFFPIAIAAGSLAWSEAVVFSLNAVAIAGLEAFTMASLGHLCGTLSQPIASAVCSEAIPALFPTTVSCAPPLSSYRMRDSPHMSSRSDSSPFSGTRSALPRHSSLGAS